MHYSPPWWLRNGHIQSIYPSLFRKLPERGIRKERIATEDDDFLDLDWHQQGAQRLLVISHGLEGHSRRPYVLGMAQAAKAQAWDVLAWNFRSCSGEPNRNLSSYHSGQTNDLARVVEHALATGEYQEIALVGFSIGGNKTLRFLARHAHKYSQVSAGVAFSVPVDLESSAKHLAGWGKQLYMQNFLRSFKEKLESKQRMFPGEISLENFEKIKTFAEFDERYTAPMNGFESAQHYWRESSSLPLLSEIKHPTLMISAKDDPFLPKACYPIEAVQANASLTLELPAYGGHVGFMPEKRGETYWSEQRAMRFLNLHSRLKAYAQP